MRPLTILTLMTALPLGACEMPSVPSVRLPDVSMPSVSMPSLPGWGRSVETAPKAQITPTLALELPTPPAYPEARTMTQVVRGRYGERGGAVEAVVSLSPERVEVVLAAPAGPRLVTILWTEDGVEELRTPLAPLGVEAESVLADLFVSQWPLPVVVASLPEGVVAESGAAGGRTITGPDGPIIEVEADPVDPSRITLRNRALGYELAIVSREVE